jgi:hypothetical protein
LGLSIGLLSVSNIMQLRSKNRRYVTVWVFVWIWMVNAIVAQKPIAILLEYSKKNFNIVKHSKRYNYSKSLFHLYFWTHFRTGISTCTLKITFRHWNYKNRKFCTCYSQFQLTFHSNVPNFVPNFANSLPSSKVHNEIHKQVSKLGIWLAGFIQ